MEGSKLTGILKSFSPGEMKDFGLFLNSGLVPLNAPLLKLLDYLQKLFPSFEDDKLDKKVVYQVCFGNIAFEDKKLRYLITDLTRHCEAFIAFNALQKEEALKQNILAKEYSERNCEKAYNGIVLSSRKMQESDTAKDAEFYYSRFETEHTHLVHTSTYSKRDEESNIEKVVGNLDRFYLAKKLQLCCEIQNVKNVLSKNYKVFLLDEILDYLGKKSYDDTPIIVVYYQILMTLLESENEKHFKKLQELLLKYEDVFSRSELRDMYQYVLNYCIKKINTGDTGYQKVLFETYKIIIANQVVLVKNRMSQWDYKNIVTISLRLQEFDWCLKFINTYQEFIAAPERENAHIYNLAFWHFYKKEYSKTLGLLQKVNFTDPYYQLDTRVIMLKIYFEQDDDETFFYHSSAFKIFLKRNKSVSEYQRTIYTNLIKYTTKLVRSAGNKRKLSELKKEIEGNRQIADIQWLLQKVEES